MIFSKHNYLYYNHSRDVNIRYVQLGAGQSSIVFLHGFGASIYTWEDIVELFPFEDYKLIFVDMKGFGASSKPRDGTYTLREQATIMIDFMKYMCLRNVILIGHSYGGGVALLIQIMNRQSVTTVNIEKLILIDCAAYLEHMPFFLKYLRMPIFKHLVWKLFPANFRAEYVLRRLFFDKRKVSPERVQKYAVYFNDQMSEYSFIKAAEQVIPDSYQEIIAAYKSINIPTQIIWGREDKVLPLANGKKLHGAIKGSQLTVVDNCGHIPQEEQPRDTFQKIQEFL